MFAVHQNHPSKLMYQRDCTIFFIQICGHGVLLNDKEATGRKLSLAVQTPATEWQRVCLPYMKADLNLMRKQQQDHEIHNLRILNLQ
jgi:hypothetical protein